jgi:hypothetical protein
MAPAWPIRRPGGAVRPATKPTTGFGFARVRLYFSRYSAASSSIVPPISPIMTIPALIEPRKIRVHGKTRTVGIVILEEDLDHVDMLRSGEGITANANAKRLSETSVSRLCDRLISQGPGARDNTCPRVRVRKKGGTAWADSGAYQCGRACGCGQVECPSCIPKD